MFVRHTVDDIDLEREIITKHGGRITDISYYIPEFKEPLTRIVENYEDNTSSGKFINVIEHETKQNT